MENCTRRNVLLLLLCTWCASHVFAQNILSNGDFEENTGLPAVVAPNGNGQAELAVDWDDFIINADYVYDFNSPEPSPIYGRASIGIITYGTEDGACEAVGQNISSNPLQAGVEYFFRFDAFSTGLQCTGVELVGYPEVPDDTEQANDHAMNLPGAVSLYTSVNLQPGGWATYSCTFTAPEEIRYIAITKEQTDCYEFFILDNVFLGAASSFELFGEDQTICEGDTLTLNATAFEAAYLWQDSSTDSIFQVTETGVYSVDIIRPGCTLSDTIQVDVHQRPEFDLGEDIYKCEDLAVPLSVDVPGATYVWQDGSTASSLTATESGVYSIEVNLDDCVINDSVGVYFLNNLDLDLGDNRIICEGDSLLLEVPDEPLPYIWSTGETGSSIQVTEAGTYSVRVGIDDCTFTSEMQLSLTPERDIIEADTLNLCPDAEIVLDIRSPDATYLWQDGSEEGRYTINEPGTYEVLMTTGDCENEDRVEVIPQRYDCFDCKYFVPNAFSPDFDGVNDQLSMLTNCEFSSFEMQIFDRWGNLVYQSDDPTQAWDGTVGGQVAAQGIYTVFIDFQFFTERLSELYKGDVLLIR